ncbi:MAG: hypothetical protein DMF61_15725 [Blastocatellia bacterium AA13]|nr:MAG: hypothetical protein DMF61_15725 [Blastocatellia bacterium AA13]
MRFLKKLNTCMIILVLIGAVPSVSLGQKKKHIAILDFEFNTADQSAIYMVYGDIKNLRRQISDRLEVTMVNLGSYNVGERREVEKVMREQDYGRGGRIDTDTAAHIGRILGVDTLIIGSITQVELEGLPADLVSGDVGWLPSNLSAKIRLNVRMVDATTGQINAALDLVGTSVPQKKSGRPLEMIPLGPSGVIGEIGGVIIGKIPFLNRRKKPSTQDYKRVIDLAVEDGVAKIAQQFGRVEAATQKPSSIQETVATPIEGRVQLVKATAIFVTGISRSQVKLGDRLFVQRLHIEKDVQTGREIRFNEKIGELEVTGIQDSVVVGTFSGAETVKAGDLVTNR